jgi:hypothetical protein
VHRATQHRTAGADDRARIEPAGQARADLDVRAQPDAHGVRESPRELLGPRGGIARRARGGIELPPRPQRHAVLADANPVPARQLEHTLEERILLMVDPIERNEIEHGVAVNVGPAGPRQHERPRLGGEHERAVLPAVVERFHAEPVPRAEQLTVLRVPQREREHTVETAQAVGAPAPVCGEHDFGVGAGLEPLAGRFQLLAQLDVVVDLAVVRDPRLALDIADRVVACSAQVDDRKPAIHQPDVHRQSDRRLRPATLGPPAVPARTATRSPTPARACRGRRA